MMSARQDFLYTAVLLICATATAGAADPQPIASIDLRPFGYKASDQQAFNRSNVKWWRHYVIIDSTYEACGKCGPNSVSTYTAGPRLVIDSTTGAQVPAVTVADAVLEPNPQDFLFELSRMEGRTPALGEEIMARWRSMTLTRDAANRVWLQEPGGDKLLIFSRRAYYHFATFLAPDRILIAGPIDDKPDSAISTHHQWVVDRSGELKYKLPSFYANITDYYAVNRDGTRFAVRDAIESKAEVLGNVLSLGAEHNSPFNAGRVRVFAASDGRQLFEYKWGLGRYEHDASRRIALSDDGSLLALLDGFRLLIFQLPSQ